jgi:leucyl-tRNA synthetase
MSKSKGNVVDPDEMINRYGADTVRLFCLFAAPPEKDMEWSDSGIEGAHRFLNRLWRLVQELLPILSPVGVAIRLDSDSLSSPEKELRRKEHETIYKVSRDVKDKFQFNTAIAAIMELTNTLYSLKDELKQSGNGQKLLSSAVSTVLVLLSPIAPHICEELWEQIGYKTRLAESVWPEYDEKALIKDEILIVIQVNGKLRSKISVSREATEEEIKDAMITYMDKEHQLLEGAAGTAVATLLKKKKDLIGKRVGVVICGGNISLDTVRDLLN